MFNLSIFGIHQDNFTCNFTYFLLHFKQQSPSALVESFIKYSCQTLIECTMTFIVMPQITLIMLSEWFIFEGNDNLNKKERKFTLVRHDSVCCSLNTKMIWLSCNFHNSYLKILFLDFTSITQFYEMLELISQHSFRLSLFYDMWE